MKELINNQGLDRLKANVQKLQKQESTKREQKTQALKQLQLLKRNNQNIQTQIDVQKKKFLALNIFAFELQRKYNGQFTNVTNINVDKSIIESEKKFLKQILIKKGQQSETYKNANEFFRTLAVNKNKSISQTKFIEEQCETIANLRKKLSQFKNQDLVCRRKWRSLDKQNEQLEFRFKSLNIQLNRQQVVKQQLYQKYIQKINQYNTKLAYLNGVSDQKIVSEHLIQQVSFLQEQRSIIHEETQQLKAQQKLMIQQLQQLKMENTTIKSFFSEKSEPSNVANKMRLRLEQLNDLIRDYKIATNNLKLLDLNKVLQSCKQYDKVLRQANIYLRQKSQESKYSNSSIDQIFAAKFFERILQTKDEKLLYLKQMNSDLSRTLAESSDRLESLRNAIEESNRQMQLNDNAKNMKEQMLRRKLIQNGNRRINQ